VTHFPLLAQPEGSDPRVFTTLFRIGTAEDAGLRLHGDAYVSVRHAECRPYEGDWYIEDCGSMNGTWVNGIRVRGPYRLEKGDRVRVGRTMITVVP
jgi:pSer/pThr/pTyr-binding forkhead associated (FHA) protein